MRVLNLTDLDKSDIKYKISPFPDGQQQITILGENIIFQEQKIQIKSRMNNFRDLELIICATQSLKLLGIREIHLYVPYFLGSRSDRQFEEGSNNYLKHVICPIINLQGYSSITVLDPHSHILEACLNGFKSNSNIDLVKFAISDIIFKNPTFEENIAKSNSGKSINQDHSFILISPDAGASHKIYKIAKEIGYEGDIITCSKERNKNGKLTKCIVPDGEYYQKDMIIIDDICDGGGTFINISKVLKERLTRHQFTGKIYLIVTHGIFSKGFNELNQYFDDIYCTNSYQDLNNNIKQLNIF